MIIIGITGTLGAGKGTIVDYLKTRGFKHYAARDFILREVAKQGLEPIRDNINIVANGLRKAHFPGYIIGELLKEAEENGENAVIESIRAIGELELLRKNKNFYLFAADAPIDIRYKRITSRGTTTDNVSFEKFVEDENKEMDAKETWNMNIRACMAQADYVFVNDGTKEELNKKVEEVLVKIAK